MNGELTRRTTTKPLAIDLFAGAGGATLGLRRAGFHVPVAVEIEKGKAQTLQENHRHTRVLGLNEDGDMRSLTGEAILRAGGLSLGDVDLMVACPPCQGFSLLGRRDPEDERNDLFQEAVRFALDIGPTVLVVENVPGILSFEDGTAVEELRDSLETEGYETDLWDLNAADYGVAQSRRRIFIVAADGVPLPDPPAALRRPSPTVWDAIADLPQATRRTRPPTTSEFQYRSNPKSAYARALRGRRAGVANCEVTHHSPEMVRRFAALGPGEIDKPTHHRRLRPDKPASTITAGTRSRTACRPIHPYRDRVLTVREGARLAGFPDWYRFPATISAAWEEIGNCVPPPLAEQVFVQLKETATSGRKPLWTVDAPRPVPASRYVQPGPPNWTERRLRIVVRRLSQQYGDPRHHNKDDPLDELIFIILSGKTSEESYLRTFDALKSRFPTWVDLLSSLPGEVERLISPGGLGRKKGNQIRRLLQAVSEGQGKADLGYLRSMNTNEVEDFLVSLPGVGLKSAKCVTMYSLGRRSFPVDTHVRRVLTRLGMVAISRLDDRAQDHLESVVPPDLRYKLHVNAITLGRVLCLPAKPRCQECPVSELCEFSRVRAQQETADSIQASEASMSSFSSSPVTGLAPLTRANSETARRSSVLVVNSPVSQRSRKLSRSTFVSHL